ncbi:MAG TPA: (Fe-S)-binding protein [Anaerolineae bacterium]|nr:(Fe-S)-binding protein [Anaerolineae bacterium]
MFEGTVLRLEEREFPPEVRALGEMLATCIQCGTCSATCPTASAMDRTPRYLWELLRAGLVAEVLTSRTFWLCLSCYSCTVTCPRGIVPSDVMLRLKSLVAQGRGGEMPESLRRFSGLVLAEHNISGEPNETRLIWSENLERLPAGLRRRRKAEVVYFVGCVASFFPMAYSIPQSFVRILDGAGVDFATLGGEEWCCGYPLLNAGMEERMAELAKHNIAKVKGLGAGRLVTTCPSCYHTWRQVYPQLLGEELDFEVLHSTHLLAELIDTDRLGLGRLEQTVTYHDPCDLGRKSGVYDAPRQVIESIPGVRLVEMDASREGARCCGGGGNVEVVAPELTAAVAARRIEQAQRTGARTLVSACQQCKRTLMGAVRREKVRMRVLDVTELVWRSVEAGR